SFALAKRLLCSAVPSCAAETRNTATEYLAVNHGSGGSHRVGPQAINLSLICRECKPNILG
ncbi:hypothetical protein SB763_34580, partial [Burkholderia sp. SIMBA_042]|uniref:hypothetical protein n=1 Tax=Burkholderia sp. SIMBA_042 TaxID=3085783 RepID=UPI00397B207C